MLELFYAPNTIASAAVLALHEAGLDHDLRPVDFANGEQAGEAYRGVNPKGRVPALVTPEGTLTETAAILEWIAATVPGRKLMPDDPWKAAKTRELMLYLAATWHVNHAHKMRGARWADRDESRADMRARVPGNMAQSCAYLEATLPFAPFATGPDLTVADVYLYAGCHWLAGDDVEIADYPRLAEWHAMMGDRPSIREARKTGIFG